MTTLATNLASKATSQLLDFEFTGFLRIGAKVVGVSPSGLFTLTSGTPSDYMPAEFTTKSNSFGRLNEKRFPVIYLKVIASRDFKIGFVIDDQETDLETVIVKLPGLQSVRVTPPRTAQGTSWSIKIRSTGGYLKVLRVEGVPTMLHPKRR